MTKKNTGNERHLEDKGPIYWKQFVLAQVKLAAHYLEQLNHVDNLEDLKRHNDDHKNLVNLLTKPETRSFFGLKWLEKTWRDEDVRKVAIKVTNELAADIDAMPVIHEGFLRMAAVRTNEYSTRTENLEETFFCDAMRYAIGHALGLYSPPFNSERYVEAMAKNFERNNRLEWRCSAEHHIQIMEGESRRAHQAAE